jgi:hypothetical protein
LENFRSKSAIMFAPVVFSALRNFAPILARNRSLLPSNYAGGLRAASRFALLDLAIGLSA